MNITETVKSFLDTYDLNGKKLLVGFSGGYDSLCLLNIVKELGYNVTAIHLNHNWRGDESLRDEDFCRKFCCDNTIDFYCEKLPDTVPHTETAAREARYKFFEKCIEKFGADAILTAHNLDDLAETLIYRILKGTGITGLNGIAENRGNFYRPLIDIKREEIENYCNKKRLKPINDSSNNDTKYRRNFIRHKLLPLIAEINENYTHALKNLAESAKETSELVREYMDKIKEETGNSTQKFIKLGKPAQNYLIHEYFIKNNLEYDRKKITEIVEFINKNSESKSGKKGSVTKGLWIFANSEKFEFITESNDTYREVEISHEGEFEFDEYIFTMKPYCKTVNEFPKDKDMTAFIELSDINFTLRYRKNGDIIHPLGTAGSKKLKKYFNDKKIPNHEKGSIPLLCNGNEVLWAAGIGLSEKIKVVRTSTHVLKLVKKEGYNES